MAEPTVVYNNGKRVVITDEHRHKAKQVLAEVDAHNKRRDESREKQYHEDLDSMAKYLIRKEIQGQRHFIIGKGHR